LDFSWLFGPAGGAAVLKGLQFILGQPADLVPCHAREIREGRLKLPWAKRSMVHLRTNGKISYTPIP
jgi:hypothetical protein